MLKIVKQNGVIRTRDIEKQFLCSSGIINTAINPYGFSGNLGEIFLKSKKFILSDGAYILGCSFTNGNVADLSISAEESLIFEDENSKHDASKVFFLTYSPSENAGNSGNISLQSKNILLNDGALLISGSFGHGDGGNISLDAENMVKLSGMNSDPFIDTGVFS